MPTSNILLLYTMSLHDKWLRNKFVSEYLLVYVLFILLLFFSFFNSTVTLFQLNFLLFLILCLLFYSFYLYMLFFIFYLVPFYFLYLFHLFFVWFFYHCILYWKDMSLNHHVGWLAKSALVMRLDNLRKLPKSMVANLIWQKKSWLIYTPRQNRKLPMV